MRTLTSYGCLFSISALLITAACKEPTRPPPAPPSQPEPAKATTPAAPAQPEASHGNLSPEARAQLAKGRALADKDLPGAIAAFTEARRLAPQDADVLSELGLAHYRAKALEPAREATLAALRESHQPRQTAAAAYNLSLIEEAVGNHDEAIRALELSLEARPHPKVESRLSRLQALRKLTPQLMQGPFADVTKMCEALLSDAVKVHKGDGIDSCCETNCRFKCEAFLMSTLDKDLPKPMSELRLFMSRLDEPSSEEDEGPEPDKWRGLPRCGLVSAAVRVGSSWYSAPLLASYSVANHLDGMASLKRIAVEPSGPEGSKLIVLELAANQGYRWSGERHETLTLFGVGASGKPGVLGPIHTLIAETGETKPKSEDSEETEKETRFKWKVAAGNLVFSERTLTDVVGKRKKVSKQAESTQYPLVMP